MKKPFNIAGLPTTWGYSEFTDFTPAEDALVVTRLKEAGAVVIGKTNTLCMPLRVTVGAPLAAQVWYAVIVEWRDPRLQHQGIDRWP